MELLEHSAELKHIDVQKDQIPYAFSIKLTDRTYRLTVNYNDTGGFFTVDLATTTGEILCYGEVLRLGKPLFEAFSDERYPLPVIVPLCVSGDAIDEILWDNLSDTVKLYLFERG